MLIRKRSLLYLKMQIPRLLDVTKKTLFMDKMCFRRQCSGSVLTELLLDVAIIGRRWDANAFLQLVISYEVVHCAHVIVAY